MKMNNLTLPGTHKGFARQSNNKANLRDLKAATGL